MILMHPGPVYVPSCDDDTEDDGDDDDDDDDYDDEVDDIDEASGRRSNNSFSAATW